MARSTRTLCGEDRGANMNYSDLAKEIGTQTDIELRPAEELTLKRLHALGVPQSVLDFYRSYEPIKCAEIEGVRLWPIADVLEENEKYVPGADIVSRGFIVFATTVFGDAYCFDISQAQSPIVLLSHEVSYEGMEAKQIRTFAKPIAPTFDGFLASFVAGTLDIDPNDVVS